MYTAKPLLASGLFAETAGKAKGVMPNEIRHLDGEDAGREMQRRVFPLRL